MYNHVFNNIKHIDSFKYYHWSPWCGASGPPLRHQHTSSPSLQGFNSPPRPPYPDTSVCNKIKAWIGNVQSQQANNTTNLTTLKTAWQNHLQKLNICKLIIKWLHFPQMSCNQWIQYMYVSSHHFFTEVAGGFFCLFSEIFLITCKGNGRNNDRTDRESNLGPLNI